MYLGLVRQAEKKGRIQSVIEHLKLLKQEEKYASFQIGFGYCNTNVKTTIFQFNFQLLVAVQYLVYEVSYIQ